MNKKINSFLFVLGATVLNLLLAVIIFGILLFLFMWFIAPHLSEEVAMWGSIFIFIAAVALSFVVYQIIIKQFTKRVDMEKYFDPILGRRKPPIRRD
jgi:ethanolamine transporter EutH